MALKQRLLNELKAVGVATLYFAIWLAVLVFIKQLILAEYEIQFDGFTRALVGALILAKVVLVLEHVPLGAWVKRQPAWLDVVLRTALYAAGVLLVMLLEKGFEGRDEYSGFGASLRAVFQHADIYHVWVNIIVVSGALLVYNLLAVIRVHLGEAGLLKILTRPVDKGDS
jgi:hypothetical protein